MGQERQQPQMDHNRWPWWSWDSTNKGDRLPDGPYLRLATFRLDGNCNKKTNGKIEPLEGSTFEKDCVFL